MSANFNISTVRRLEERMQKSLLQTSRGRGVASSDAVTLNALAGVVVTESKSTSAAGTYTITITNSRVARGSAVIADVDDQGTGGTARVTHVAVTDDGQFTVTVRNVHVSAAFAGAHLLGFKVLPR